MKKFAKYMALFLTVLGLAFSFSGCTTEASNEGGVDPNKTYRGTVKVTIFNNADVTLTVEKISNSFGAYSEETEIAANQKKSFEVQCGAIGGFGNIDGTAVKAYYTSGASVAYPFAGTISGETIKAMSYKADGSYSYYHDTLNLNESGSANVSLTLNFVKYDGKYVLARVK
ncbi:MAG: hypothetical protein J6S91_04255 [Treponema sp.]|nr:hypothetical protein [Treponema sp.]